MLIIEAALVIGVFQLLYLSSKQYYTNYKIQLPLSPQFLQWARVMKRLLFKLIAYLLLKKTDSSADADHNNIIPSVLLKLLC